MRKILITGGAGFIGSNLCGHFIKENFVRCLDNFSTGSRENIKDLLGSENFELIEADISNYDSCLRAVKDTAVVFHHAALGSVPRSVEKPLDTNASNITGFLNMIEASRVSGVKRFIFASSSSVYGSEERLPKVENFIGDPLSPYAVTKVTNEKYARVYAELYGMEVIGLRYFNVFGPNQNPNGAYAAAIPRFINQFRHGEEITIYGNGESRRDFTYIANVVKANVLADTVTDTTALSQFYNIGFGAPTSINELVQMIKATLERKGISTGNSQISYAPLRKGEIIDSFASIAKAKQLLKYDPDVDVAAGIQLYIDDLLPL